MSKKPDILTRMKRACSAKAAVASLAIHAVLILFAGSIVAVRYVQKMNAEFDVQAAPPKLERRQLQAPAKLERVRQTRHRPKMISRTAPASATEFSLPDMGALDGLQTQKFSLPFSTSSHDIRLLARGIGLSAPQIEFLRVRGEGEKVSFILEVSPAMLSDETGGAASCEYIRQQLSRTLSKLPSSVLFNVVLYNGDMVSRFSDRMLPVLEENRSAVDEWLAPLLRGLSSLPLDDYQPVQSYDTAVGSEATGWLRALQSALEQRPDTVFLVARDWGRHPISREKGESLLAFSLWEILSDGGRASVAGSEALRDDRELRNDLLLKAVEELEKDTGKKLPGATDPFVHDLIEYIQYSENQIVDHVDAVCQAIYISEQQAPPRIHAIRLVAEKEEGVSDSSVRSFNKLTHHYNGEFAFLNGPDAAGRMDIAKQDGIASETPVEMAAANFEKSRVNFFGMDVEGARVTFVLDASPDIFAAEIGGTNTFEFLKKQLLKTVQTLRPGTGVNVIVCDRDRVVSFRPEITDASGIADDLSIWMQQIAVGTLPEENRDAPEVIYPSAIGSDIQGMPLALQVAMQQQTDCILMVSTGLGRIPVSRAKAQRLLDFSVWSALGGSAGSAGVEEEDEEGNVTVSGGSSATGGGMLQKLSEDKKQIAALLRQALARIGREQDERKRNGLPLGFVHDIFDYIEYTPAQIVDHLAVVANTQYPAQDDEVFFPGLYFVRLVEGEKTVSKEALRDFRSLQKIFTGEQQLFYCADSEEEIRRKNWVLSL